MVMPRSSLSSCVCSLDGSASLAKALQRLSFWAAVMTVRGLRPDLVAAESGTEERSAAVAQEN
jgi:hypothetical protein